MAREPAVAVRVRCFGALRERLGAETLVTEPVGTVGELWSLLTRDRPELAEARGAVRAARNLSYCGWETAVEPGDEVAFMPPVAGGAVDEPVAPRLRTELVTEAIDAGRLAAEVRSSVDGAVASFAGVVRGTSRGRPVLRLEYEAYPAMAEAELRRIAAAVAERHGLSGLTLVHRVGSLAVGEVSVAVVAAALHREPALRACAEAIELIKRDLPVWKREHHPDGADWVDARELDAQAGRESQAGPEAEAGPVAAPEPPRLTHVDASGAPHMVDVSERAPGHREAAAEAMVRFGSEDALETLRRGSPKGDVLAVARLAGIMAAKRTPELIPLCHPLPLTHVEVSAEIDAAIPGVRIRSSARCVASTGVEMEALTAAAVAGLTVVDMLKSADPWMTVEGLRLLRKSGGRSGTVERPG
jgi:cyclic pyranopterin phosphate synthase